jgi:hypothetical protein
LFGTLRVRGVFAQVLGKGQALLKMLGAGPDDNITQVGPRRSWPCL